MLTQLVFVTIPIAVSVEALVFGPSLGAFVGSGTKNTSQIRTQNASLNGKDAHRQTHAATYTRTRGMRTSWPPSLCNAACFFACAPHCCTALDLLVDAVETV